MADGQAAHADSRRHQQNAPIAHHGGEVRPQALIPGPVDDFDELVDDILEEARASGSNASDWQNTSIGPRRMRVDLRPLLSQIRCPTLFIQGDQDIAVKPAFTVAAAAGARYEPVPGAGHWVNRQEPDRIAALVLKHLD